MKKFLCSILCTAMLLPLLPTAFAADVSGLSAFVDSKQYSDNTFSDVSATAWYAPSVETVYEKDIMDGTGGGKFDPQSTIPWAQAVTIAARLHAIYHGGSIPAADGPWYAQYLAYARENGLLPAICPDDAEAGVVPITREGLAVLFRSVLDEKDLPAVNDQNIPDLDSVRAEYRDTISEMFASGIFTGKDGLFDPNGKATRAEVATIVTRLLCPGQRVSHDSRQNPYMADQMGNFYNGGLCARLKDTVYYIHSEATMNGAGKYSDQYFIFARTDSGEVHQVYDFAGAEKRSLDLLSVGPDGLLYFVQWIYNNGASFTLKQLNPATGTTKDIYTTTDNIKSYMFYDKELYVCEGIPQTKIGLVSNGRMTTLAAVPEWENLYVDETMYCFGGKLCWLQLAPRNSKGDDHLMILDLKTRKTSSITTKAHEFAYQGATVWTTEFTDGNFPTVLKRRSLAMPELTETVRVMDGEFAQLYDNLYANGSQLYYQVSGASKLWTISASGQTEEIASARTQYYEASAATSQGIALMWHDSATMSMSGTSTNIDFILPDGQRTRLPAILNRPYYLKGANQLSATNDQATWAPDETWEDIASDVTRAYTTADGDVVLEVKVTNLMDKQCHVVYATLRLSGTVKGDACFYVSTYLESQQSETFTFVFPKESVEVTGRMEGLEADAIVGYQ